MGAHDFLGDHASHREAQQVEPIAPERAEDIDCMTGGLFQGRLDAALACSYSRQVQQDKVSVAGERIYQFGAPVVHVRRQVDEHDEGKRGSPD